MTHIITSTPDAIWYPHVTVAAVIEVQGQFLLVEEEADNLVVFNQPAGHLDPNESLIEAAIRETLEETAWQFTPQAVVGIYQHTSALNGTTYLRVCFSGKAHGHDANRQLDTGILRAVWMTHAELRNCGNLRSPMVLRCIEDYLAGQRFPLSMVASL